MKDSDMTITCEAVGTAEGKVSIHISALVLPEAARMWADGATQAGHQMASRASSEELGEKVRGAFLAVAATLLAAVTQAEKVTGGRMKQFWLTDSTNGEVVAEGVVFRNGALAVTSKKGFATMAAPTKLPPTARQSWVKDTMLEEFPGCSFSWLAESAN